MPLLALSLMGCQKSCTSAEKAIMDQQGVKIEITNPGDGSEIRDGQIAVVHYRGRLTNGQEFDSSYSRGKPFQFRLGTGQVIKGWDIGVSGMKVGGKRTLTIPSDLGYGSRGAGGVIPPGATLIFDVELVDIGND